MGKGLEVIRSPSLEKENYRTTTKILKGNFLEFEGKTRLTKVGRNSKNMKSG